MALNRGRCGLRSGYRSTGKSGCEPAVTGCRPELVSGVVLLERQCRGRERDRVDLGSRVDVHIWRDGDRIVERAGTNVAQLAPTVFAEHRDLAALAAKDPLRVTIVAGNLGWLRRFPEHLHTIGLDSRLITNALPVWRWQFRRWQQEDFAVDLEWIVAEDGPARERLVQATRRGMEDLQSAVVEHTCRTMASQPVLSDRLELPRGARGNRRRTRPQSDAGRLGGKPATCVQTRLSRRPRGRSIRPSVIDSSAQTGMPCRARRRKANYRVAFG